MPTDQEETVVTGLAAPAAPEQKSTTDTAEVAETAAVETAPVASADVPLVQVAGLGADVTTKVEEIVQQFPIEVQRAAENENLKRDFMEKVAAANRPEDKPYTPPAVPIRIAEQTRLEMAAGAQRVAEFEAQKASRPQPKPQQDGTMTPVFRPADFVPNQKKGEGLIASASARTL